MATKPLGLSHRAHEGFHTITPYLVVNDAQAAIGFYQRAFGAVSMDEALKDPGSGKIVHAELRIGDSPVMLTDETPEFGNSSPKTQGGSPVYLHIYVDDADAVVKQAIACGAKELIPVGDQFYGSRSGRIQDPYGHIWIVDTQKEDWTAIPQKEKQERLQAFMMAMKLELH